jgi:hypothetical protein
MNQKVFKIFTLIIVIAFASCSGSKKYFKAAEKLEKQGLVSEAAEYYYVSLQRKSNNTDARIKLKEVGQKHVNNVASSFFREYNTQQYEQSIETFDKLKDFTNKASALSVNLNFPSAYQDDYVKALDYYLNKNYKEASNYVNQSNFDLALKSISKINKYDQNFKNTKELELVATCEPLYLKAVRDLETKNYANAQTTLDALNRISTTYKDAKELLELTNELLKKSFIIFQPKQSTNKSIEENLFNNFIELSYQHADKIKLINNSPFFFMPGSTDVGNAGNLDLLQAIKKATGADYFYVFDVSNKKEIETPATKSFATCYEKFIVKKDTLMVTEFKPMTYNQIKSARTYSYDYKFKLIDANTNQIISSRIENCNSIDNIDYYEFVKPTKMVPGGFAPTYNVNNYFPYNPALTNPVNQYNPNAWRARFSNRKTLKSFSDLKTETDKKAINLFSNTLFSILSK